VPNRAILVLLLWCSACLAPAAGFSFSAKPAPELDALFQQTHGWIGADGAFTVALSTNTTLWLFSDTFVGTIVDGKRTNVTMINNSVALQRRGAAPEFFFHTGEKPESFIKPLDGVGYFWLMSGNRGRRGLFLLLSQVKTVKPNTPFGFQTVGLWLGHVANPDDPPLQWRIAQTKVPFAQFSKRRTLTFGTAVLDCGGFTYLYGCSSTQKREGPFSRAKKTAGMVLARVLPDEMDDFKSWRFFSNGEWSTDPEAATFICADAPAECSVSFLPVLNKYVLVYTTGIWGQIVMRTAPAPTGPWSEPTTLFRAPEMQWSPKVFSYAGKAHPELAGPDELIITYAANSFDFWELIKDARLYWPRFVRVELASR
jgi:hypothetical protein